MVFIKLCGGEIYLFNSCLCGIGVVLICFSDEIMLGIVVVMVGIVWLGL